MNEERDKDENGGRFLPGTPPLVRGEKPGEFERMRGETQLPGTRVLAVPPPEPPPPVGIAPPDPRNVVSNFDTRPVGAYDFALSGNATMGNGEVATFAAVNVDVPDGYTAVLRKVRLEWTPPASMLIGQPGQGTTPTAFLDVSLLRNEAVIANNTIRFLGELDEFEWNTHQVYGYWESMGVRLVPTNGFAVPANVNDAVYVNVTFFGVLIPTKGKPPNQEIASDPVVVREYDSFAKMPPQTGAAGSDPSLR